jgi:hypothetical protein
MQNSLQWHAVNVEKEQPSSPLQSEWPFWAFVILDYTGFCLISSTAVFWMELETWVIWRVIWRVVPLPKDCFTSLTVGSFHLFIMPLSFGTQLLSKGFVAWEICLSCLIQSHRTVRPVSFSQKHSLSWQFKKNKNPNFETSLLGHSTLSICSQYLKIVYAVILGRTWDLHDHKNTV